MRILTVIFILFYVHCNLYSQDAEGSGTESNSDKYTVAESGDSKDLTHSIVPPDALPATRKYQSEAFTERKFDNAKWQKIVGDTDYKETKRPVSKTISAPKMPWAGPVLRLISYAVIISIVVLLLYNVIKNTSLDFKVRNNVVPPRNIENTLENIEEIDFDNLLALARREGNFKLAVRLYYLSILKKLNAAKIIVWKRDKTNRDYLFELFSSNHYFEDMRQLTAFYEAVWYGEHRLTSESFQTMSVHFENVSRKIGNPAHE
jgi:hypothetical protein